MVTEFFSSLEQNHIDCVVFKSFEDIERLWQDQSVELDVYVPVDQRAVFRSHCAEFGFTLRKTFIERDTEFFYALEGQRLIMLHVAYHIITGSRFKNFPLGINADLLESRRRIRSLRIGESGPYTYYHTIKYILLGISKHWNVIANASSTDRAFTDARCRLDYGIEKISEKALETRMDIIKRNRLKRRLILSRIGRLSILTLRHLIDRIGTRLRWIFRGRGFAVAFVGIDGSGKSTLTREIQSRLFMLGCKKVLYLGPKHENKVVSLLSRLSKPASGKLRNRLGAVTVYDRYLYDMLAYRNLPPHISNLMFRLIPKPEFTFYCHADTQTILARKTNDNPAKLADANRRFETMFAHRPDVYTLDTRQAPEVNVKRVMEIMAPRIERSFM